jgi:excinuclease UvrABC nuclease subunit
VYKMIDACGTVIYVGVSADLRARVRSYWTDPGDRPHLRGMIDRVVRVDCVLCPSMHAAVLLEQRLIEELRPPYNRSEGMGSRVWLRLVSDPVRPSLEVVFDTPSLEATEYFGPLMGWKRARLAVKGILQVYPLPYASSSLQGADRELGDTLGVGPRDLMVLQRRIAAVLRGNGRAGTACLTRLLRLRREAAAAQAFELAEEIQERIGAVRWLLDALGQPVGKPRARPTIRA